MATVLPAQVHLPEALPSASPASSSVEFNSNNDIDNTTAATAHQDRTAGSSSPSPSTSSSAATADSATAKSAKTVNSSTSSTSTLARLSALAKATTKLHFIAAFIPSSIGPKHAAALIQLQAPPPVMAIEFKPLVLTPVEFSLTDGTSIPAPLDSPPQTPVEDKKLPALDDKLDLLDKENAAEKKATNGLPTPVSTPSKESPRRPTGIRKFLSLRGLSSQSKLHKNAPSKASTNGSASRPGTSLSVDSLTVSTDSPIVQSLKHKRSAGWFNSRRKSNAMVEVPKLQEKKGPPPPTIPELKTEDEDMHADDMFKDIK